MSHTIRRQGAALAVVALVAVGCGDDSGTDVADDTTAQTEVAGDTTETHSTSPSTTEAVTATAEPATTASPSEADTDADGTLGVVSTVVSDASMSDITVWAPEAEGSWPVVFAFGAPQGGARIDFNELATQLANAGVVVLASDWPSATPREIMVRSNQSTELSPKVVEDFECGYRLSREIAEDFGGDLTRPVTMVGYDKGATAALYLAIGESKFGPDGTYDECLAGAPRPDVVVAMSGCYHQNGFPANVAAWGNLDANITLVAGSEDRKCGVTKAERTTAELQSQGYDTVLVEIAGADHYGVTFRAQSGEKLPPDDQSGQTTVQAILDAMAAQG